MQLFDKGNNNPAVILKLDQPALQEFSNPHRQDYCTWFTFQGVTDTLRRGMSVLTATGASVSVKDSQEDVRQPPEHQISSVFVIQSKPRQCKPSIHIIY